MKRTYELLRDNVSANAGLVLCGLSSLAIWLVALYAPAAVGPALGGLIVKPTAVLEGPVWLMLLLFVPYWIGYRIVSRRTVRGARTVITAFSLLSCIALITKVVPTASHDIYLYVFHGRALALHGVNPYAVFPVQIADPFVPVMGNWLSHLKNTYGPLWTSLAVTIVGAIGDRPVELLVAFKALSAAFFLGSIPLISRLFSAADASRTERARDGLMLLFAWNPTLLFEFVGNGHNDSAMVFFLLAALLLSIKGRTSLAALALSASFLVKYFTLLCLPFFIIYAVSRGGAGLRERTRAVIRSLLPVILATVLAYAPYWMGLATFDGLFEQATRIGLVSLSPLAFSLASLFGDVPLFGSLASEFVAVVRPDLIASLSLTAFFVSYLAFISAAFFRAMEPKDFVRFVFAPLICYLLTASLWFMPWYLSWIITFLIIEGAAFAAAVVSVTGMLLYAEVLAGPMIGAAFAVMVGIPAAKAFALRRWSSFRTRLPYIS